VSASTTGARGAHVHVEPSADAPLVWFDVAIRGGAAADPVGAEGLHRHAALLARRGAGSRDRAALDEALDNLGASLEISVGRDAVTLSGLCLTRNLDAVVDLASDVLASPRLETSEHERLLRETPQVLDEVRDDDSALATRWFDWQVAPGHPYGRTSLGTEASLAQVTLESAAATWRAEVVPTNLVVGVAGDVTDERAASIAARLVERLPAAAPRPLPALPGVPFRTGTGAARVVLVDKADRTQAQLRFGHLGPRWGDPDTAALLLVETAFGGMFSSRLMQEIRVKRGWSYGAGCALRRSRGPHWFEMWMATDIAVAADAVGLTRSLYADLTERGLTAEEIDFARGYLVGALPFHLATARQRMQLAVRDAVFGLPAGFTVGLPHRLGDLDDAAVRAACQRNLRPGDLVTVAVTTAEVAQGALERAGAGPVAVVAHDEY
jgi:zinc protease